MGSANKGGSIVLPPFGAFMGVNVPASDIGGNPFATLLVQAQQRADGAFDFLAA